MQNLFPTILIFLTLSFSFLLGGCTSGNPNSPQFNSNGKHPADWVERHGNEFRKDSAQCITCHGSVTDPASTGGISGVSCFSSNRGTQTCHANGPSVHPSGWEAAARHGRAGAMADPSARSGFAYCSKCHGAAFDDPSCLACHTKAPHPDKPWHGTTSSGTNHVNTDPENASECAKCHLDNRHPPTYLTVPIGATPGCFNSTLCHGQSMVHPTGWGSASQHGVAAKAAVTDFSGFGYCRQCHGSDYAGSGAASSCFSCHSPAPHADAPWIVGLTHVNTDQSNAQFCAGCHYLGVNLTAPTASIPEGTTLGCFNATLCHGQSTTHPAGWASASQHGVAAKAAVTASTGLGYCQQCHGSDYAGSGAASSCFSCHSPAPHADAPWMVGLTHVNTDQSNAQFCAGCHYLGVNLTAPTASIPAGTTLGCFNATLCHGSE